MTPIENISALNNIRILEIAGTSRKSYLIYGTDFALDGAKKILYSSGIKYTAQTTNVGRTISYEEEK